MPFIAAIVFLTRLPLRLPDTLPDHVHGRAMAWFAVVGAGIGLVGGAVYGLATVLNLPPMAAALLTLSALVLLTGALHEDGLADVADGFGGGGDVARKLEIMRDSRVGSYGVLAVVFSVGLRAAAIAGLESPGAVLGALVAAHALSRAVQPAVAWNLPPARRDGLGNSHGRTTGRAVAVALATAALITAFAVGANTLVTLALAALTARAVAALANRQIGGYTGDVLGAVQQAVETAVLLLLAGMR